MNENKNLLKTLKKEHSSKVPVWIMRQAGRYLPEYREIRKLEKDFLSLCYNPELASTITMQPIKRFDLDAAIIFSDILVIPHALGINIKFEEKKGPILEKINIKDINSNIDIEKKLKNVYSALNIVKEQLPSDKVLIGFAGAPWTLASYIIEGQSSKDFHNVKKLAFSNNEDFNYLIDILIKYVAEHLILQIKNGAEVVQIFESWASCANEYIFDKYILNPINIISKIVKKEFPDVPIIVFPRGCGFFYKKFSNKYIDCLGIDGNVPISFIRNEIQNNFVTQGNMDNIVLLSNKDSIRYHAEEILNNLCNNHHIFNLGHGILPETPIENVEFLIKTIRDYKK